MIKVTNSYNQQIAISALGKEQRIKISNLQEQVISVKEIFGISNIKVSNQDYGQNIKVGDVYSDAEQYEIYEGAYEITPKFAEQKLSTANKVLTKDVTIEKIPITRVSNTSGGNTIIIGG